MREVLAPLCSLPFTPVCRNDSGVQDKGSAGEGVLYGVAGDF
ncbi:hypothetical protein [Oceanisphaera arctica]|nr:hypothetical protein [Oceanisphaera arctica]